MTNSYVLLSDAYGHEIEPGADKIEDRALGRIQKMYDNGILHDSGWAARNKVTGGVGFLAYAELPEGGLSGEAVDGFVVAHGLTPQIASGLAVSGDDIIVCFVPSERLRV